MSNPAKVFYRNPSYDGQLVRTLSAATVQSADPGEAMATARRIKTLNGRAWYEAWVSTADNARRVADESSRSGDRITARHAFLRASEYYRQAYYFIRSDLDDARLQQAYGHHVETFQAATALMDIGVAEVRIPYERTTLHGYLFSPDTTAEARPTLIFPCGYDSTAEAGWTNVPPALQRGYNVLVFDGPGQGEALLRQRLFFRPDFENVLSRVLDWLVTRPEVDAVRVGLVGRSFAGYLAPRAACFDGRLAALVCDPAQPDMGARIPKGLVGRVAAPVVRAQTKMSRDRAEFFGARMAAHGIDSIERYFDEFRLFTMLCEAGSITCPTLIVEAENDFAGGGGQVLYDALHAPAELVRLTETQGAGGHCAGLGQEIWAGVVYGWLHRTLAAVETTAGSTAPSM